MIESYLIDDALEGRNRARKTVSDALLAAVDPNDDSMMRETWGIEADIPSDWAAA